VRNDRRVQETGGVDGKRHAAAGDRPTALELVDRQADAGRGQHPERTVDAVAAD
jgi:hypothetical protein